MTAARLRGAVWVACRWVAGWLAVLTFVNVVLLLRHPDADESLWWIDLRWLGRPAEVVVLIVAACALLAWAVAPGRRLHRRAGALAAGLLAVAAARDVAAYYRLWSERVIAPSRPVPLSLITCAALVLLALEARREPPPALGSLRWVVGAGVSLAMAAVLPLAQIAFFGTTDYRRPADAAVVFGARVMPDGAPSIVLADRVRTAVDLYHEGLVHLLVLSGGVESDSGYDETAVMQRVALDGGVPPGDIVLDPGGTSTAATVSDTTALFRQRGIRTVLAVSHFYHLPRIKLAYERAGLEVYTVPAHQSWIVPQTTENIAREIPALWWYYVRAAVA